ncbi:hypothetical protein ACJX0J_020612, partial [Zea mays]
VVSTICLYHFFAILIVNCYAITNACIIDYLLISWFRNYCIIIFITSDLNFEVILLLLHLVLPVLDIHVYYYTISSY